jgi:hypothetical protein
MSARKLRSAVALALAGLLLLAGTASGQGAPRPQRATLAAPELAAPATAPAAAPAQELTERTYLPMLRDARLSVVFGSGADENFVITQPSSQLPAGITRLYVNALIVGYQGSSYRIEAIYPDGERLTDSNRPVTRPALLVPFYLCLTTASECGTGEQPLPAGVYTIELFINDQLARSFQATLQ